MVTSGVFWLIGIASLLFGAKLLIERENSEFIGCILTIVFSMLSGLIYSGFKACIASHVAMKYKRHKKNRCVTAFFIDRFTFELAELFVYHNHNMT